MKYFVICFEFKKIFSNLPDPPFCGYGLLQLRERERKPPPHEAVHSVHSPHSDHWPSIGGELLTGQGGLLGQYISSRSGPTQRRPPNAGSGLPQERRRVLTARPHDCEQADQADHSVQPPWRVQLVTSWLWPRHCWPPLAGNGRSQARWRQVQRSPCAPSPVWAHWAHSLQSPQPPSTIFQMRWNKLKFFSFKKRSCYLVLKITWSIKDWAAGDALLPVRNERIFVGWRSAFLLDAVPAAVRIHWIQTLSLGRKTAAALASSKSDQFNLCTDVQGILEQQHHSLV